MSEKPLKKHYRQLQPNMRFAIREKNQNEANRKLKQWLKELNGNKNGDDKNG